jgi:hypothetical protein
MPVVYRLKGKYISPHLYKVIVLLYLETEGGFITFHLPGQRKDVKKMSLEKYKLLYEPDRTTIPE